MNNSLAKKIAKYMAIILAVAMIIGAFYSFSSIFVGL